jgi:hypothetical protein
VVEDLRSEGQFAVAGLWLSGWTLRVTTMTTKRPATEVEYIRLDEVESEPGLWLWERRIPLGGLSVLFGQPKVGKGVITASLASMVTLGTLPGDLHGQPANVMIAWSEDPNASVIMKPQIETVGGNPERMRLCSRSRLPRRPSPMSTSRWTTWGSCSW